MTSVSPAPVRARATARATRKAGGRRTTDCWFPGFSVDGILSYPQIRTTSSTRSSSWTTSRRKLGTVTARTDPDSSRSKPRPRRMRAMSGRPGAAPISRRTRSGRSVRRVGGARRRVHVDDAPGHRPAAEVGDELRRPVERGHDPLDVGAALEPVGGLGGEAEGPRGAADRARLEAGALEQDGRGPIRHLGIGAAHHPAHRDRPRGVTDHQHVGCQGPVAAVERGEALAGARPAHHDAALREGVEIERVQGLAQLPEDVVGGVDHVVDGAQAGGPEPLRQPGRRGPHGEPGDHPGGIAGAEVGVEDLHRGEAGGVPAAFAHAGHAAGAERRR